MKFVILDVYPQKNYRLIKDTAGGSGTGNNFGNTLFSKLLNRYVDQSIGMPAMEVMYISSILKKNNEVHYTREIDDPKINIADFVILPSSIIAHETEINTLKKINHKQVFVTGIFSNTLREKYESENSVIVKNEADTFFYNLQKSGKLNKEFLIRIFKEKTLINQFYSPVSLDDLPFPDWGEYSKRYPLKNDFFGLHQKIAVPILATRGCPYSCFNYCTYPLQQGRKVRARSVGNLIKEIRHINKFIEKRVFLASEYLKNLKNTGLKLPFKNKGNKHVYHLFTVYHPKKNIIEKLLKKKKIETRSIYPFPIQSMKAYKKYNFSKDLKVSEKKAKGIFSLPLYPEMNKSDIIKISQALKKIMKSL